MVPHEHSVMPSRYALYEEVLNRKLQEAARAAVSGGQGTADEAGFPAWARVVGTIAVVVLVFAFAAGTRSDTSSRLATRAGTMFSAELAGAGASPEELVPPAPLPTPEPPSASGAPPER